MKDYTPGFVVLGIILLLFGFGLWKAKGINAEKTATFKKINKEIQTTAPLLQEMKTQVLAEEQAMKSLKSFYDDWKKYFDAKEKGIAELITEINVLSAVEHDFTFTAAGGRKARKSKNEIITIQGKKLKAEIMDLSFIGETYQELINFMVDVQKKYPALELVYYGCSVEGVAVRLKCQFLRYDIELE